MGHGHGHGIEPGSPASASGKHLGRLWIAVGLGAVTLVTQVVVGLSRPQAQLLAGRQQQAASSKQQSRGSLNRVVQAMALRGGCVGGDMDECRALRAEHPLVQIADEDLGADVGHIDVDLTCARPNSLVRNQPHAVSMA